MTLQKQHLLAATAALTVALTGVGAHAADAAAGGSEFFHQAGSGSNELTGILGYESDNIQYATTAAIPTTYANKTTGLYPIAVQYEYGFNDMFAAGIVLGYASETTTSGAPGAASVSASGLPDLPIYFKGNYTLPVGKLHYGVTATIALEKGGLDYSTGNSTSQGDGGYTIDPNVGYDINLGPGVLGAQVTYVYQGDRDYTQTQSSADVKLSGGSGVKVDVFYEYDFSNMLVGLDLNYGSYAAPTATYNGTSLTASQDPALVTTTPMGATLYGKFPVGPVDLIPKIADVFSLGSNYTSSSTLNVSVAARWAF